MPYAAATRIVLVALALVLASAPGNGTASVMEADLKAAFVYRFASLTTWPDSAFIGPETPIRFGVFRDDDFAETLRNSVAGRQLAGRDVVVEVIATPTGWADCHVLFVPSEHVGTLSARLRASQKHPVLTVSDAEAFATNGGVIELAREGAKLRFSVNRVAASQAELKISSKLLRLAERVIES